jgi:ABC-type lipoprotein export system ATPase subunit/GNAT superfamily N-acetyltransferase
MGLIELKSKILNDKYTEYVYENFDIQNREETIFSLSVDLKEAKTFKWNIGLIIGGSGSGKTSILKKMGDVKKVVFDENKPLISNFDWMEPCDAALLLTSIGLSSVPTWLKPFNVLSNGEQYRATLAYLISSAKDGELILVDEYTSVVDRDVAKAMSYALQKYVRRTDKRIILASCHYDILEWLMPDWICSPEKGGTLERCDYLRRGRPQIELQISRVEAQTWDIFKKHHYLTDTLNKSCQCFLFEWNNKPVAFVAVINFPSGTIKNAFRLSRTVVLPDYQGLGIGSKISEFCSAIFKNKDGRIFTKTVNPALGIHRDNSPNWKKSSKHGKKRDKIADIQSNIQNKSWAVKSRVSYCHEYVGDPIEGYEELLLPINDLRKNDSGR